MLTVKWFQVFFYPPLIKLFNDIQLFAHSYLPNPSARAGYDTRSIFKRSLTGLNSEFSFSYTSCLTKTEEPSLPYYLPIAGGRIIGFISFPRVFFGTWSSVILRTLLLGGGGVFRLRIQSGYNQCILSPVDRAQCEMAKEIPRNKNNHEELFKQKSMICNYITYKSYCCLYNKWDKNIQ